MTDTDKRWGERLGWLGGWFGTFFWVLIFALFFLWRGQWLAGSLGLVLTFSAAVLAWVLAPWQFPHQPYWRLLVPLYLVLGVCVWWAIWGYGGWANSGLRWWNLFMALPFVTPLIVLGARRWDQPPGTRIDT
jgi:hypothetical protein